MKNWDSYFLEICNTISKNSKCLSRQIGSIIVKDKSIISTGYNGPPRGVDCCSERYLNDKKLIDFLKLKVNYGTNEIPYDEIKGICPRRVLGFPSNNGLEWCIAGHSERNSIINAARHGISVKDSTLYCNCPVPCTPCLIEIINSGIKEVVVVSMSHYDEMSEWLIQQSNLKIRVFNV